MIDGTFTQKSARHFPVAAVVLAAGCSRRMGSENKLLSNLNGKPIALRVVETVSASGADSIVVVTGHEADRVRSTLADCDVQFVHNGHYSEGLSTSLCTGIRAVPDEVAGALICLGDMPLVTARLLTQLIEAFSRGHGRRVCLPVHHGRRGNPVLMPRAFFPLILELSGDQGARTLLTRYPNLVEQIEVENEGIFIDIDTPDDLGKIRGPKYLSLMANR
ncbi:nucleotidyltransferase family protein [Gammaproteobacteria bacterium]|nr:nucleotidyltransferase family protein [Gammaproteobacteria bacterium]